MKDPKRIFQLKGLQKQIYNYFMIKDSSIDMIMRTKNWKVHYLMELTKDVDLI